MRSKPALGSVGLAAYVCIVLATAAAAFLPKHPNVTAYLILLVITLPVSIIAAGVGYVVIGMSFSDSGSMWLRLLAIAMWTVFVALELAVLREIRRTRRRPLTG